MYFVFAPLAFLVSSLLLPFVFLLALFHRRIGLLISSSFFPRISPNKAGATRPTIWFHAASLGEYQGLVPLIAEFKRSLRCFVAVSCTSLTAYERLSRETSVDAYFLLPYDHPFFILRLLRRLKPALFLVAETELWPNLFSTLSLMRIPIVLVNGRLSDYSFPKYLRFSFLFAPFLRLISRAFVQSELDGGRFKALGLRAEKISVLPSTKHDRDYPSFGGEELEDLAGELGIDPLKPCFVAGCVRKGEEGLVLDAFEAARASVPDLQMLFVPRHPEYFDHMAQCMEERGLAFHRRSAGNSSFASRGVCLLDTIGELNKAYALSSFSLIGGTLIDIGGHNPLEAAAYAKPLIVGPYCSNYADVILSLRMASALVEVDSATSLCDALCDLSIDFKRVRSMGEAAKGVSAGYRGSTEVIVAEVLGSYERRLSAFF